MSNITLKDAVRAYLAAVDAYKGMSTHPKDYSDPMSLSRAIDRYQTAITNTRTTLDAALSTQTDGAVPAAGVTAEYVARVRDTIRTEQGVTYPVTEIAEVLRTAARLAQIAPEATPARALREAAENAVAAWAQSMPDVVVNAQMKHLRTALVAFEGGKK